MRFCCGDFILSLLALSLNYFFCPVSNIYCSTTDTEYSINEAIGFPNDCKYLDVIEYWGNRLSEEEQPAYFAFFDIAHLTECFE